MIEIKKHEFDFSEPLRWAVVENLKKSYCSRGGGPYNMLDRELHQF